MCLIWQGHVSDIQTDRIGDRFVADALMVAYE